MSRTPLLFLAGRGAIVKDCRKSDILVTVRRRLRGCVRSHAATELVRRSDSDRQVARAESLRYSCDSVSKTRTVFLPECLATYRA